MARIVIALLIRSRKALAESGEEVGEPDEYLFFTINPKNNGVVSIVIIPGT
ncbi:hypothetical protein NXW09_28735 [Bacteroides ovatus]|nr:hypothetical protein [Bacteroides ovatus]